MQYISVEQRTQIRSNSVHTRARTYTHTVIELKFFIHIRTVIGD